MLGNFMLGKCMRWTAPGYRIRVRVVKRQAACGTAQFESEK